MNSGVTMNNTSGIAPITILLWNLRNLNCSNPNATYALSDLPQAQVNDMNAGIRCSYNMCPQFYLF